MALPQCKKCRSEISSDATACPRCGAPRNLWIVRLKAASRSDKWQVAGTVTLIGAIAAFAAGARDIGTILVVMGIIAFVVGRLLD